jgi:hypothetical protein
MTAELITYLGSNYPYFMVFLLILFVWDLIDLYVDRKNYRFLRMPTFWVYYLARGFWGIIIMELVWTLNLVTLTNKYLFATVTPFLFTTFLQNLVVAIGGQEINIRDVFLKFRDSILESLASALNMERNEAKSLLSNSHISIDSLREECRIVLGKKDFEKFESTLNETNAKDLTLEYIDKIVNHLPPDEVNRHVKNIIKRYTKK